MYAYKAHEKELNFTGIQFPVAIHQIPKFEQQNNISINAYTLKKYSEKFSVVPHYITLDVITLH